MGRALEHMARRLNAMETGLRSRLALQQTPALVADGGAAVEEARANDYRI